MTESGAEFENIVAEILKKGKIFFTYQPALGGIRPDFLATGPNGTTIVVEAKSWKPDPSNISRAGKLADLYKQATGADYAFVVAKGLEHSDPSKGVVSPKDLVKVISEVFEKGKVRKERVPLKPSTTKRKVFAAMPFKAEYDDVYSVAMAYAAESVNAVCIREDHEEYAGDVVAKIKEDISDSIAVIADLSESNPNVLYEIGFANGIKKRAIHICSTPLKELPFNVSHWNAISYSKGQTHALREKLAKRLQAVLQNTH